MKKTNVRKLHRILGLALFLFLVNATLTGVLRTNAKSLYWKDRAPKPQLVSLTLPLIPIEKVFEICKSRFSDEARMSRVELKSTLGKPVYLVEIDRSGKELLLVDAASGEVLSPLPIEFAVQIARSFARENDNVVLAENMPSFKARKTNATRPAIRVLFDDSQKTEVFIDRDSGETLSVLDQGKRFGVWVNRLHELDFAGMGRVSLSILGTAIILLSVTGLFQAFPLKILKNVRGST